MAGPIDAITAIHNAFRKDMEGIDAAALGAARGTPGLEAALARFRFCNESAGGARPRGGDRRLPRPRRRSRRWSPRRTRRTIAASMQRSMP